MPEKPASEDAWLVWAAGAAGCEGWCAPAPVLSWVVQVDSSTHAEGHRWRVPLSRREQIDGNALAIYF